MTIAANDDAAHLMRWAYTDRAGSRAAAARVREDLTNRYAEPAVARTLLQALDA